MSAAICVSLVLRLILALRMVSIRYAAPGRH
jgi:hypothetical protein